MRHNQCEAWITCEGLRLPEFPSDSQHGEGVEGDCDGAKATATCFVPSQAGKAFSVHLQTTGTSSANVCKLYMDGSRVDKYTISSKAREIEAVRTGPTTKQPFLFSELVTTEDDDALHRTGHHELGTIKVSFWTVEYIKAANPGRYHYPPLDELRSAQAVHEQSKKAANGAHRVTLGDAVTASAVVRDKKSRPD
ncbi:hypothetical protein C8Q80DRAFT_362623 [Daedaleopsis nitida]|nr:hypothetical protein C8Q80DRAFT_362623 [Daedaleopsis nitida]